jgi:4-amino-4-deoxy-L-arabinose transferase-like glycosyltransferase
MTSRRSRGLLALILLTYLVLGVLFAVYTPRWQAPDEPAHYNYIRYLAENRSFPVLQMGDYPHAYMEEIKGRRFPPDLSIDPIRYEYHQPPLYYSLAAPVYLLAKGNLLALRLLSVVLGAGIVLLAYATGRRIYPAWPALALAAAAFVAFLPQHLATVSQAGNDVLAELLFALVLYQLVGWLQDRPVVSDEPSAIDRPQSAIPGGHAVENPQHLRGTLSKIVLGCLLGLILITKTTAYIAAPLALGVLGWCWLRERVPARRILADLAWIALPAALIALPWYARDMAVYGWPDFLGLQRHGAVVVGQLRLGEYLAQFGAVSYLQRLIEFTFKSFWGVFGWQGVFMDSRIYLVLAILSALAAGGLVLRVARCVFRHPDASNASQTHNAQSAIRNPQSAILLAATILLTLLVYAGYNLEFVQHQGRYLFTALIPLAIFFALGWDEAVQPRSSLLLALGLLLLGFGLLAWAVALGPGLPKWPLALILVFAACMAILSSIRNTQSARRQESAMPRGHAVRHLFFVFPYVLLPLLSLYALFGAILPQLTS